MLEPERVRGLERDEAEQAGDRGGPEHGRRSRARRARARRRARRRHAGRSSPRAIGRRRLTGCCRSASTSRRSLTRYAALEAAQYATNAATASSQRGRIAELGGEDDPGEEQQVLHPLPRPQRDERRPQRRAPPRQLVTTRRRGQAPAISSGSRRPSADRSPADGEASPPVGYATALAAPTPAPPAARAGSGCPRRPSTRARSCRRARAPARARSAGRAPCRGCRAR